MLESSGAAKKNRVTPLMTRTKEFTMLNRRAFFLAGSGALAGLTLSPSVFAAVPASATKEVTPTAEEPILLNFNENSLGLAKSAQNAIQEQMATAFRYPDAVRSKLIADIGAHYGLKSENVTLGNGSSETIQAALEAQFHKAAKAGQKVQVIAPDPTFGVAQAYTEAAGVAYVPVPLKEKTLQADVAALKAKAEAFDGLTVVYFCNPNNPTGVVSPATEFNAWVEEAAAKKANVFFLVDEAYGEYVDDPKFVSGIELVKKGLDNLIVSRTFSKLYALAGLRIGYGIGTAVTAKAVDAFASIDNTNAMGAAAASATLADKTYLALSLEATKLSKKIVTDALDELGIEYLPSQANFSFHKTKKGVDYKAKMAEAHIMVGRAFPPYDDWNRLTLGTPGEMKAFVKVLKDFRKKGWI